MLSILSLFLVPFVVLASHFGELLADGEYSDLLWLGYKAKYAKYYIGLDEIIKKGNFLRNLRRVEQHNHRKGYKGFRLGLSHLSDLSDDEFNMRKGFKLTSMDLDKARQQGEMWARPMNVEIPDSIDWREKGYVTEVKDQENCGSCYSFSATGALEGQAMRFTGKLPDLSEQNIIDCSSAFGNNGCNGGLMTNVYDYVKANRGIDTEDGYPYQGEEAICKFNKDTIGAEDNGYTLIDSRREEDLKIAVATVGPVAVAIEATTNFQGYSEGVFYDEECGHELDHAVLVVGYGTDSDEGDYWIVKNSWGDHWGEDGYIRMARNRDNNCGIADMAVYPNYSP